MKQHAARNASARALMLPGAVAALSLAAVILSTGAPSPGERPAGIDPHRVAPLPIRQESTGLDSLDRMRGVALEGNFDASVELARQLLDRFERAGDPNDLYEAFQWIARDWGELQFLSTDVVQRALLRHCGHKVLQWHWLCVSGE